ncbi:metallophosphoesterase [Melioribacteraceae bacterium 4301-Me]|uniref:metallophosphoesterase n=1 Tax=Pyranulibacter aquaticus TaxID=3163344 RepID=UPI0035996CEC
MTLFYRILLVVLIFASIEFVAVKRAGKAFSKIFPRINKSKFSKYVRWLLIFVNLFPVFIIAGIIYNMISGSNFVYPPESILVNFILVFPFWIAILIMIQAVLLWLPVDLLKYIFIFILWRKKEQVKLLADKYVVAIIAFCVLYVPVRVVYDYYKISVRPVEYVKKNLPHELDGFKITFISDLQADPYTNSNRLKNYIQKVNETSPDLVLIGGDMITSTPDYINESAEYVGKIKSKYGVYSCVGDHDNWAYSNDSKRNLSEIENALAKYNVKMLDNKKIIIPVKKSKIGISFVTNTYVEHINNTELDSLTNLPEGNDFNILLTHQPRQYIIDEAIKKKFDLMLAGHTHGGQITFLFPFFNLSPTLLETKYVRGDFYFGNLMLIVTRGLGMSIAPFRYNSTPEITVIRLTSS